MITEMCVQNKKRNGKKIANAVAVYAVLIIALLVLLLPFYVLLTTSFKTFAEAEGAFTFWPKKFTVESYKFLLFKQSLGLSFSQSFLNTLIISVPCTIVSVFVSTMAAFVFAKYHFVGRDIGFSLLLFTMMIPSSTTMMPQYIIYSQIGWTGTRLPLMAPAIFGGAGCIFFMRQFISGIPTDLIEAARVDGMNKFKIFITIIFPLAVPALISQGILTFISYYNDYFGPLIYCQSHDMFTLQVILASFNSASESALGKNIPNIMAGSVISMLPLVVIYIFTQKFFVSGIAVSGLKG